MTSNEYKVNYSFAFNEEIIEQDSEFIVGSLDVDCLFTIIPLEKTIDIYTNTLFENTKRVESLSKIEFKELLSLATKGSFFIFNGKLYKQVDGVAMGSPFSDTGLYTLKRTGYKIVHLALNLITTSGMLIFVLFISTEHLEAF